MPENIRLRAGHGFFVRKTDDAEGFANAGLQQYRGAGFAEATVDHVFFHGDYGAAFMARFQDGFRVERLDAMHGDDSRLQALFGELARGEQRVSHSFAGSDERNIIAFS